MKIFFANKEIQKYGLMIVLGLIISIYYIITKTKGDRKTREDCIYVYILGGICGLAGSKVLYLLINIKELIHDFQNYNLYFTLDKYLSGGFVFYGGLIVGYFAEYLLLKSYKSDFNKCTPILITSCLINFAFGRIGCTLVGCCYGVSTNSDFYIVYENSMYAPNGVKLIPVQIYEIIFDFVLAIFINYISDAELPYMNYVNIHITAYSIFRFIIEFYRGDEYRGMFFGLSTSQIISIILLIYLFFYNRNKKTIKE